MSWSSLFIKIAAPLPVLPLNLESPRAGARPLGF
jgi:hypothetical protein